ncbi:hypothetical protein TGS27_1615 [Geobacillus stearothermophilus]|nr:hypothetical protein TGS27_1615 [Geobacillus stearothermophilus]
MRNFIQLYWDFIICFNTLYMEFIYRNVLYFFLVKNKR